MDTTVTIKRKDLGDEVEMEANNLLDQAIAYFKAHQSNILQDIPTRPLTEIRPIVNNVYEDTGNFLDEIWCIFVRYEPVVAGDAEAADSVAGQFM